ELTGLRAELAEHHRQWQTEQEAARSAQENRRREQMRRLVVARVRELLDAHRYEEAGRTLDDGLAGDRENGELLALRTEITDRQRQWKAEQAAAAAAAEALRREQARQEVVGRVRELLNGQRYEEAARAVKDALAADRENLELLQLSTDVANAAAAAEALRRDQTRDAAIARVRELMQGQRYE